MHGTLIRRHARNGKVRQLARRYLADQAEAEVVVSRVKVGVT